MHSNAVLQERAALTEAAISLEPPARVRLVYQGEAFSPWYTGVPPATHATDPDASEILEALVDAGLECGA